MWNLEIEIWKPNYLHVWFILCVSCRQWYLWQKPLLYSFSKPRFSGKNIRKIASNFPLKCYIERSLSPWIPVFSHLTTYFCLLVCWVLFQFFIKNGPMSLTKASLYLPENTVQSFLTLTEKDQHTNTFS